MKAKPLTNLVLLHDVGDDVTRTGFKATICNEIEAESRGVICGSLKSISDPELHMIEAEIFSNFRLKLG